MAEELDVLLECIDEPGGFRDACTVFLRSSVEALEEGMGTLSENCRMLKVIFHCNGSLLFLGSAIMYHSLSTVALTSCSVRCYIHSKTIPS